MKFYEVKGRDQETITSQSVDEELEIYLNNEAELGETLEDTVRRLGPLTVLEYDRMVVN